MLTSSRFPSDGGPIYVETNLNRAIAEPFNALTASLFFCLAIYWLWRVRKEWNQKIFFVVASFILAIGGIGGTLYHGLRSSRIYLLMDFVPIGVLCIMASWYFWRKAFGNLASGIAVVPFFILNRLGFKYLPRATAINTSYFLLSLMVLAPLLVILQKTHGKKADTIGYALLFFVVGLLFRVADPYSASYLPMGTHWLWHIFSFLAVFQLMQYTYQLKETKLK